ncbi:MAG: PilZ domain-containing protein [Candidatus Thiodiazotropha sp. 'RUGA']|nr:PilZ domain-containing protein [Candidatus Thiodiazotropha sp. 'RUGA']
MYIKSPAQHIHENSLKPDDRRSVKRRHLIYYLRVWRSEDNTPLGQVVDINSQGLMLIGEKPIPTGEELALKIHLPDEGEEIKFLNFKAICRWSSKDINTAFYDSGCEFVDQSDEKIEQLQKLIEEYGFSD